MCAKGEIVTVSDRKNEENMHERVILCIFAALKTSEKMEKQDIHRAVHTGG